jgi:hypothetical protein
MSTPTLPAERTIPDAELRAALRERDITIRYLKRELERAEAEVEDRERLVGELHQELAGIQ